VVWPNAAVASPSFCYSGMGGSVIGGFTTRDQPVGPVDFALQKGAALSGTLRAADVPGVTVPGLVWLFSQDGQTEHLVSTIDTDAEGNYTTVGVPAGTYFIVAYFAGGAGGCELYGDGFCAGPGDLDNPYGIDFGNGTPIVLADQESKSGIDVHMPVRIFAAGFD
jgi:hypothetical protein